MYDDKLKVIMNICKMLVGLAREPLRVERVYVETCICRIKWVIYTKRSK
jgi:hypothetical protein